jgi:methylated-DNA-[protein]-cysteine S-methyltransferase
LALSLASPARPVASACGANPIPIVIPCHRVVAADGLGGYSGHGGIETKVWLLKHEGAASLLI